MNTIFISTFNIKLRDRFYIYKKCMTLISQKAFHHFKWAAARVQIMLSNAQKYIKYIFTKKNKNNNNTN